MDFSVFSHLFPSVQASDLDTSREAGKNEEETKKKQLIHFERHGRLTLNVKLLFCKKIETACL